MVIFFDIDETLVNQRRAETVAAARLLRDFAARLPQPRTVEALCRRWRLLREKHAPAYLQGVISYDDYHRRRMRDLFLDGAELTDVECDDRYHAFLAEYQLSWGLFDDVLPCLDALAGFRLGILSNGNSVQQRKKLERTGILERFSVIVLSEEVGCAKPHGGVFQEARRQAGLGDFRCLHLGDRLDADARGSCAAGFRGVWLDRSRGEAPADVETIHSLDQLPALLHASRAQLPAAWAS